MNWDELDRRDLFTQATTIRQTWPLFGEVRAAVDKSGRWEELSEWRISTYETARVESLGNGFRAFSEKNGRFSAGFSTLDEAWEALRVLSWLGGSLFYALHWTTNDSTPGFEPDPDRGAAEAYFRRLAQKAVSRPSSPRGSIVTARPPADWNIAPDQIYVVTVGRESLVLECDCTTEERADLFLRVFDALADDLLEILGWKPLPAAG